MKTHAQVPTPLLKEEEELIRVYFATRPEPGKTLIGYVDLNLHNPKKILMVSQEPVLALGKPGTFDEHGVMPSCAVRVGNDIYLYYSGWSRAVGVPYTNSTGLAVSHDGGRTYEKISDGPVLSKSIVDPYSATSPFVLRLEEGWLMWYCSGTGWISYKGKMEHVYDIKLARSVDGIYWTPTGEVALEVNETEQAITRPWIDFYDGHWYLYYCYRKAVDFRDGIGAYRLGLAVSSDLKRWVPNSGACLDWPREDWDLQAQSYPAVATLSGRRFLFHNGNGFGTYGFGVWKEEGSINE